MYERINENIKNREKLGNWTFMHCARVSSLAGKIAEEMGYSKIYIKKIENAAMLHDIGKIDIPSEIINKKSPLTLEEFEKMKNHTIYGEKYTNNVFVKNVIKYHHEKYDGTGYPYGLKGEEIPLEARIVTVADVYDALANSRPYKPAWEIQHIINFFKSDTESFDPKVKKALLKIIDN